MLIEERQVLGTQYNIQPFRPAYSATAARPDGAQQQFAPPPYRQNGTGGFLPAAAPGVATRTVYDRAAQGDVREGGG